MEINLTENSYSFMIAKRMADKALNEGIKLLLDNEDTWQDSYNLKLHDAFCTNIDFELNGAKVTFSDDAQNKWFYMFCDSEYDCFKWWLKEEHIDENILDYIDRTSSFYIGGLHSSHLSDTFCEASPTYCQGCYAWKQADDGHFETNVEDMKSYCEDLEKVMNCMLEFAENFVDEVKASLENITKVYDYITDFKENQVENFKAYVEDTWKCNAL